MIMIVMIAASGRSAIIRLGLARLQTLLYSTTSNSDVLRQRAHAPMSNDQLPEEIAS